MKSLLKFALTCGVMLITHAFAGPIENKTLFDKINTHWSNREYTLILSIIKSREQVDNNDILARSLRLYYHIFAEKNIPQAHQVASKLHLHISTSHNQKVKELGQLMIRRVVDIPIEENAPWGQDQINAIHQAMDEYPFIQDCFVLWALATDQID